jgi:hypothetical protein
MQLIIILAFDGIVVDIIIDERFIFCRRLCLFLLFLITIRVLIIFTICR